MNRILIALGLLLLLATAGWAMSFSISRISGGGALASSSGFRLNGAIGGYGLPFGFAGRSAAGSFKLGVGFYPCLAAQTVTRNSADPAWLEGRDSGEAREHPGQTK